VIKPRLTTQKFVALSALAALLSVMFVFMGTPLLRVLRNAYGPLKYWSMGFALSAAMFLLGVGPMAFLLASVWIMVGLYNELEGRGHAGVMACAASTAVSTLILIGGSLLWFREHGLNFSETLKETLSGILAQVGARSDAGIDVIIKQSPSLIFITMLLGLAFALMFDRRTAFLTNLPFERVASQLRLLELRLPDWMLWLTMFSMLLAFVNSVPANVSALAMNIFNIMVAAYFFQGIAILEVSFVAFRVGPFVRLLTYIFIVGQLFLLISAAGFIDYWVDFRRRLRASRLPSGGNHNNGEKR
jgi:hypothetical protein